MRISDWKISTRLHLGFGLMVALLVALAVTVWFSGQRAGRAADLNRQSYDALVEVHQLQEALAGIAAAERAFALTGRDAVLGPYRAAQDSFARHMEQLRGLEAYSTDQGQRLGQIDGAYRAWLSGSIEPAIRLRRTLAAGSTDLAPVIEAEAQGTAQQALDALHGRLAELEQAERATLAQRQADAARLQALTQTLLVLGTLVAAGLAVGGTLWLTANITGPLRFAVKVAQQVARGDLTARIEVRGADETSDLMRALRDMNAALVTIVGQVRAGTQAIASGATEIASGNQDLSARTEQQASSLEETASSMEELTATVKHNADNARQADRLAHGASEVARRGGAAVAEMVDKMGAIDASAQRIVDIVAVIDSIAFQTNILALNAAVEAARAGEQGRGFAVVASEVRTLAQRSAAAAKEIKGLIDASVEEVAAGSRLAESAGSTMHEIVGSVQRVCDLLSEISSASDEQRAGIEQVNAAIVQMEQVTQQNAALVEQAAAAAATMEEQAQRLNATVRVFALDDAPAAPAHGRRQPQLRLAA